MKGYRAGVLRFDPANQLQRIDDALWPSRTD
jgi:hypothetical protein